MPKIPKKQLKNKKRAEKKKRIKASQSYDESTEVKVENNKWGKVYIAIFVVVALAGAGLIVLNA